MQETITEKLQEITELRREKPEQVIAEAIEIGLEKMWIDSVLGRYLKRRISRVKAIHLVGLELVRLAEQQEKIVRQDVKWGRNGAKIHN